MDLNIVPSPDISQARKSREVLCEMRRMHSSMAAESGGGGKLARFPASFASSEALRAGPGHTSGGRVHLWREGRRAVSVRQAFSRWPPSSTARAARGSARRGPGAGRRWPAATCLRHTAEPQRRTLTWTCAGTFKSRSRIVPKVARASPVPCRVSARSGRPERSRMGRSRSR